MNFVVGGYELDVYWGQERFAVELDLFETHGPRLKREPEIVIERVRTLLERRRRPVG